MEHKLSAEKRYEYLREVMILSIYIAIAFIINRGIRISGLYMDDLYLWSTYGEQSFLEYVFPFGSTRFRPVYWIAAWLEFALIGGHITWIVPINIIFAGFTAGLIYLFAKKLSSSTPVAFIIGLMFVISRFSYYDIAQVLGLMEAMALVFVLAIFYFLYEYQNRAASYAYYVALAFYLAVCYTHERFMVLIPLFFFVLLVQKDRDIKKMLSALFVFAFLQITRAVMIGTVLPAGTAGTNVADTITLKGFLWSLVQEIAYLFGIHLGPVHLNGIMYSDYSLHLWVLVFLAGATLAVYMLYFIYHLIDKKVSGFSIGEDTSNILLFIGFIGATMVSCAVTIRVEMRWVYAPYMLCLLFLAYVYGEVKKRNFIMPFMGILLWAVCMLLTELSLRSHYDEIYLFPNQRMYNSLADQTYFKYGADIYGKEIYIIGNRLKMSDFTKETFFKVYGESESLPKVHHIDSVYDIGQVSANMIILKEDMQYEEFVDITQAVREMKREIVSGYYEDTWLDEEAELNIMAGKDGIIQFEFLYPGDITGEEYMQIIINDEIIDETLLSENIFKKEFHFAANEIVNFKFKNNFYYDKAEEVRGDTRLSILLNIASE